MSLNLEVAIEVSDSIWQDVIPDSVLLHIFSLLDANDLTQCASVCTFWRQISLDESLWQKLVRSRWSIDDSLAVARLSWRSEYKRLHYHAPVVETEVLRIHEDEIFDVVFANSEDYFLTVCKDTSIVLWKLGYPCKILTSKTFKDSLCWSYVAFAKFNSDDTRVIVRGTKLQGGDPEHWRYVDGKLGCAAVLSVPDLMVYAVVPADPPGLNAAWLTNTSIVAGQLKLDRWGTMELRAYKIPETPLPIDEDGKIVETDVPRRTVLTICGKFHCSLTLYLLQIPSLYANLHNSSAFNETNINSVHSKESESCVTASYDKGRLLVFVTQGLDSKICIHYISNIDKEKGVNADNSPVVDISGSNPTNLDYISRIGHREITGTCLSHDHRFLYFNYREYECSAELPENNENRLEIYPGFYDEEEACLNDCVFSEKQKTGAVDLLSKTVVLDFGNRGHTINTMPHPWYIGLDESADFLASGSADASACVWDKHYKCCVGKLPQNNGVVNGIAFCPQNQECLVTVCDDRTIRVWRSRNEIRQVKEKAQVQQSSQAIK